MQLYKSLGVIGFNIGKVANPIRKAYLHWAEHALLQEIRIQRPDYLVISMDREIGPLCCFLAENLGLPFLVVGIQKQRLTQQQKYWISRAHSYRQITYLKAHKLLTTLKIRDEYILGKSDYTLRFTYGLAVKAEGLDCSNYKWGRLVNLEELSSFTLPRLRQQFIERQVNKDEDDSTIPF